MGIQVVEDWDMFVISAFLGMVVSLLYDILRAKRAVMHTGYKVIALEDIIYWIFCAGLTFFILYRYNMGQLRYYVFLGMILGAVLYYVAFSWLINAIAKVLFFVIFTIFSAVFGVFSLPFRLIYEKSVKVLKNLHNSIRIVISNK